MEVVSRVGASSRRGLAVASIYGIVAGIAAGLAWFGLARAFFIHGSFMSILVGPLVGYAVWHGAGRKGSTVLQVVSLVVTLMIVLLVEVFVMRMIAVQELKTQGVSDVPLWLPLATQWKLLSTGLVGDAFVADEGSTVLPFATPIFFGMSLYYALRLPRARAEDRL